MKINVNKNNDDFINQTQHLNTSSISNYSFYKEITVLSSQVNGTGGHSDFPVLISLLDTDLRDQCQVDGDDIAFYSGTALLDYEIEDYDGNTGKLVAWVRIPSLSTNTNTILQMYFGNSDLSSSETNPSGVWNENFIMVNHLSGDSYIDLKDSTSNDNDVSRVDGTPTCHVTGKISNAVLFTKNDDDDGLIIPDSSTLDITDNLTLSAWVKPSNVGPYDKIICKSHTQNIYPNTRWGLSWDGDKNLRFTTSNSIDQLKLYSNTVINPNQWYHLTGTVSSTTTTIFLNGNHENHRDSSFKLAKNDVPLTIGMSGYLSGHTKYFEGKIDEVRISNTARSAGWIATEYKNQNDPNSFYTIGKAIKVDEIPPTVSFLNPTQGFTVNGSVLVTTTVSDNVAVTKVEFYIDDVLQHSDASSPYNFDWDTTKFTNGTHDIKVIAYDAVGNINTEIRVINVVNSGDGSITLPNLDIKVIAILLLISTGGIVMMGVIHSVKSSSHTKKPNKPIIIIRSKVPSKSENHSSNMNAFTIPSEPKITTSKRINHRNVYAKDKKKNFPLIGNQNIRFQQSKNQRSRSQQGRVQKVIVPQSEAKQAIIQRLKAQQLRIHQKKSQQLRNQQTRIQKPNFPKIRSYRRNQLIESLEYLFHNNNDLQEKYKKKIMKIQKKNKENINSTPQLRTYSLDQLIKMVEILLQNNEDLQEKYKKKLND